MGARLGPKLLVLYTRFQVTRRLRGAGQRGGEGRPALSGPTVMIGRIVKIYQSADERLPITETRVR